MLVLPIIYLTDFLVIRFSSYFLLPLFYVRCYVFFLGKFPYLEIPMEDILHLCCLRQALHFVQYIFCGYICIWYFDISVFIFYSLFLFIFVQLDSPIRFLIVLLITYYNFNFFPAKLFYLNFFLLFSLHTIKRFYLTVVVFVFVFVLVLKVI